MLLLRTHSHTSERAGYEVRKNAKKKKSRKHRPYKKANHPSKPTAYRQCGGGRNEKGAMARPTTVKTLSRIVGVTGGAKRRKAN